MNFLQKLVPGILLGRKKFLIRIATVFFTALFLVSIPIVEHAKAEGTVALSDLVPLISQSPKLMSEINKQLSTANIEFSDVICDGQRFSGTYRHLSGKRFAPYVCLIGPVQLTIESQVRYYDKNGREISASGSADLFAKAMHMAESNPTWNWITKTKIGRAAQSGDRQPGGAPTRISNERAFQDAKELGTLEAWQAFLSNFPTGFRADLARAYTKKLSGSGSVPNIAPAPRPVVPSRPIVRPAPVAKPAAVKQRAVDLGPGTSSWYNKRYFMEEGNGSVYAAAVESNGMEFVAYCNRSRKVGAVLYESQRGFYPDFNGRVRRGLLAARGRFGDTKNSHLPVRFSSGSEYFWRATQSGLTGDLIFGDQLRPNGRLVADMMSQSTMTISAPPFIATFQLTGSRAALCTVINKCGVSLPGCRRYTSTGVASPKSKAKKQKITPQQAVSKSCSGGRYYSRKRKRCACPKRAPHWYGNKCRRYRDCPGDSVLSKKGKCVKFNEPVVKKVRSKKKSCTKGRRFSSKRNKCVCPKSQPFFYGNRCRRYRDCPGDSVLKNGRCIKEDVPPPTPPIKCRKGQLYSQSRGKCFWPKRAPVRQQKPQPSNKTIIQTCNALNLACSLGVKSACKKFVTLC